MIGSLLYLTASKPGILFSVGLCARFQQHPREVHLTAVKRIFRYLIGTLNLGLWFKHNKEFGLIVTMMLPLLATNLKEEALVEATISLVEI